MIAKRKRELQKKIPRVNKFIKARLEKELSGLEFEEIGARGAEVERQGAKNTIQLDNEDALVVKSQKDRDIDFLEDGLKKGHKLYLERLVKVAYRLLGEEVYDREVPKGCEVYIWKDRIGFNLAFKTADNRIFKGAFKVSYITKYDYSGVDKYIFDAIVKMQNLERKRLKRETGIILPEGIHL